MENVTCPPLPPPNPGATEREIRAIVTNDTWLKIEGMKNEPHEDLAARDENINRQTFKSASWLRERQGSFLLKNREQHCNVDSCSFQVPVLSIAAPRHNPAFRLFIYKHVLLAP